MVSLASVNLDIGLESAWNIAHQEAMGCCQGVTYTIRSASTNPMAVRSTSYHHEGLLPWILRGICCVPCFTCATASEQCAEDKCGCSCCLDAICNYPKSCFESCRGSSSKYIPNPSAWQRVHIRTTAAQPSICSQQNITFHNVEYWPSANFGEDHNARFVARKMGLFACLCTGCWSLFDACVYPISQITSDESQCCLNKCCSVGSEGCLYALQGLTTQRLARPFFHAMLQKYPYELIEEVDNDINALQTRATESSFKLITAAKANEHASDQVLNDYDFTCSKKLAERNFYQNAFYYVMQEPPEPAQGEAPKPAPNAAVQNRLNDMCNFNFKFNEKNIKNILNYLKIEGSNRIPVNKICKLLKEGSPPKFKEGYLYSFYKIVTCVCNELRSKSIRLRQPVHLFEINQQGLAPEPLRRGWKYSCTRLNLVESYIQAPLSAEPETDIQNYIRRDRRGWLVTA